MKDILGLFLVGCFVPGVPEGLPGAEGAEADPEGGPGAASAAGAGRDRWGPAPGDSAAPEFAGLSTGPLAVRGRGSGQRVGTTGTGTGRDTGTGAGWSLQCGDMETGAGWGSPSRERGRMETPGEARSRAELSRAKWTFMDVRTAWGLMS